MKNSKKYWTVYCHTTPSGKRYIGITCKKPEHRWNNGNGYIKDTPFGKAIEKYKWENIKHEILDTNLDEFEAKCLEEYYIFSLRTFVGFSDCNGYNCTLGGEGSVGYVPTEEHRRKIGKANKGRKLSEEQKRKIGESSKGRPAWNKDKQMTEEFKSKISASLIGNKRNKGKHHSEEHNRKISASRKGKQSSVKGKHWKLIDGKRVYYE